MTLVRGLSRSIYRDIARGLDGISDPILAAFADGTDGFYFDFSKTDRQFQNATGTVADDAGENIRSALDSHGWAGRTLSQQIASLPELVSNGDGSSLTGWTGINSASLALAGGALQVSGGGVVNPGATQPLTFDSGAWYSVSADYSVIVNGGTVKPALGSTGIDYASAIIGGGGLTSGSLSQVHASGGRTNIQVYVGETASATAVVRFDNISAKKIAGNHGLQATAAAQPKYQTGGFAQFDGLDDNLLSSLAPSSALTIAAAFRSPVGNADVVIVGGGSSASSARAYIGLSASNGGKAALGWGAESLATAGYGSGISDGTDHVLLLTGDATSRELWLDGVLLSSAAPSGAPGGTTGMALGAFNNNGTAQNFFNSRLYAALALKRRATAYEIGRITAALRRTYP